MIKFFKFSEQIFDIIGKRFNPRQISILPEYEVEVKEIKQSATPSISNVIYRRGFVLKSIIPNTIGTESNKNLEIIHKKTNIKLGIVVQIRQGFTYISDGEVYVDTELNSGICLLPDKADATNFISVGDKIIIKNQENYGSPLSHEHLNLIKDDLDFFR